MLTTVINAKIGDAMLYVNCPINHLMPSLLNRECMFKSGIAAVMNHEIRISNTWHDASTTAE
ncbi:hypothetical protein [Prevotella sp.]|uniref:Uncharacterized protein n=1 Tax=Prevotella herbatica TaxID=2801997 RepID=A0ABM7P1D0_9BACT|nr:hypothetical protein [Prevotella sp.]MDN5554722.1 hypothetical protein [Prevotella sp.]BCS86531.1 hypothetical protein prwr041_24240 [Prevotella herbatica]